MATSNHSVMESLYNETFREVKEGEIVKAEARWSRLVLDGCAEGGKREKSRKSNEPRHN